MTNHTLIGKGEARAMTVVPILLYHSVSADPAGWIAPFAVEPHMFARHVDLIAESGRTAMTVSELRDALCGQRPLPPRPIVMTFDDGFADFAQAAVTMASHNISSTQYITTGALRGRGPRPVDMAIPAARMLDWSQLAELSESKVEIGAHTHTHPQLDTLRPAAAYDEIQRCKHLLEDELSQEVTSFAYPHGFNSARVRRSVQAAGYTSACGVMNAFSSDSHSVFALARLTVRAMTGHEEMAAWLAGCDAPVAPFPERLRTKAWRTYRRLRGSGSTRGVIADVS